MRKAVLFLSALAVALGTLECGKVQTLLTDKSLEGRAEDLWGNEVDLSDHRSGLTLLHPFSPCNCGYCLFDEEFVFSNYGVETMRRGGSYFAVSLFASQLDNYTYLKHFRGSYPVITWPPALHRYHRDGFPWLCAFVDGERVYSGVLSPYEETFRELRTLLWGEEVPLVPTSPLQMATRFIVENEQRLAVVVVPDREELPAASGGKAYVVKRESELSEEDLEKNLSVRGTTGDLRLDFLAGEDAPVAVRSGVVAIGDYEFPADQVGVNACFPNPHNPERYVVLQLAGKDLQSDYFENWTDYTVYKVGSDGVPRVLLCGLFEKRGRVWSFSREKAWASDETESFCKGGKCRAPAGMEPGVRRPRRGLPKAERVPAAGGVLWSLGGAGCRFPRVCADGGGGCVVVWEEGGDIEGARISPGGDAETFHVESGAEDSFNPVPCVDGRDTWVFYLSDKDGFYRLYGWYGREGRGLGCSRLSGDGAADCVTPAAVAAGQGSVVVAWSEWRANQRCLQYRRIDGRVPGEIREVRIKSSDIDYTNAWAPSLSLDPSGRVWGSWNQHYPLTLGVYAGNLTEEASQVSRKEGEYPSVVTGRDGARWVVWESFMWDVLGGKDQRILAARSAGDRGAWSLPEDLSSPWPGAGASTTGPPGGCTSAAARERTGLSPSSSRPRAKTRGRRRCAQAPPVPCG